MLNYRNRHKDIQYTSLQVTKDNDEDGEETELFTRKASFREIPTEEKVVEDGDTLQSISIRYHCPVAELKRLNNIHKENEIFARNTIRVPVRSFNARTLVGVHTSGKNSPEDRKAIKTTVENEFNTTLLEDKLTNLNASELSGNNLNAVIFNSNINKSCDINESIEAVSDVSEEDVQLLPNGPVSNETLPAVHWLGCSGADADISWIALIICVVILIFAVPLIYVLYIAEHPEEYHHRSHRNLM